MPRYDQDWVGLDVGREGLWEDDVWIGVIEIIARHEGEGVYDPDSPIYDHLEESFPGNAWRSWEESGRFRPLFRDYPSAWTKTQLIDLADQRFSVTPRGHALLAGRLSAGEVLTTTIAAHDENGEAPFAILAAALDEADGALTIEDLYFGVMRNYRPGDDLAEALALGHEEEGDVPPSRRRRLRAMMRILERVGAAMSIDGAWVKNDSNLLRQLRGTGEEPARFLDYRRADETRRSTPADPFPVDPDAVDRALQAHAALQNDFAEWLQNRGVAPKSPGSGDPDFDLAWVEGESIFVAEIKSLPARELSQLRLGLGQALDYRQSLRGRYGSAAAVLVVERKPSDARWLEVCRDADVRLTWPTSDGFFWE